MNINTLLQAKKLLKQNGWSYRKAAPVLQVHYSHICQVLNGHRKSKRLVNDILNLKKFTK